MTNEEMRISLADGKVFKESLSLVSDLVTETKIKIKKEGIELVAMDPANVSMVILNLKSAMFTEYKVEKDAEIGMNLSNLKQVLRRMKSSDIVSLWVADNKFHIAYNDGKTSKNFDLPIIDLEEKEQKVPDLKFAVSITTSSEMFSSAIEDVDIVAESASFKANPNKFMITAEGELNTAKIEIPKDDNTSIKLAGTEDISSKYSVEYLKKMAQGSKLSEKVNVNFSKDYPLKLEFKEETFELSYILAPRVEND